jgi:hypothetical protein
MRQHANQMHDKKGLADEDLFDAARLQSWFQDGKERYWVVDESQRGWQERQAYRATIQDVGEESHNSEADVGSGSSSEDSQDDANNDIYEDVIQGIEDWRAAAKERLLEALEKVPAAEIDSWLQYTG